jgi:putative redox protein
MSTTAKISWVDGALFVAEGGSGHHHDGRRA